MKERLPPFLPFCSIPTLHPVIFHDDCSGTFNYLVTGTGGDQLAQYNANQAYTGLKGMLLRTKVTGAASGDYIEARRYISKPRTQLVRLQLMQGNPRVDAPRYIDIILYWYDGTTAYVAYLRMNQADQSIFYAHNLTPEFTPTGLSWESDRYWWNHIDLAINLLEHRFESLACNGEIADLSAVPLPSIASSYKPSMSFTVNLQTRVNSYQEVAIDHVLITPENP